MSANTYCKMLIILICLQLTPLNAQEFDEIIFRKSLAPAVQFESYGIEFKLRDRMKYYGASGVSIAVVKNKNLVFAKGYGTLAESSPNIVNEQTLFQAASLSKAVTALGIMHLVTTKQLSLDEPINNYLTSWEFEDRHKLTLRQLLSHTAGVNNASYPGYEQLEELPSTLDILNGTKKIEPVRVVSPIGQYKYSGGGYSLLQLIIENVSKQTFAEYMNSQLFKKFMANQSTFEVIKYSDQPNIAKGHGYSGNAYPLGWFNYPQKAAAGLWSTPSDLARLLIAYMKAYQGIDNTMMQATLAKELSTVVDSKMGLGFGVHGNGIDLHIDHAGWTKGYRAYMVAFPERGDAVVVMANSNFSNRLIEEIMRSVSNQTEWSAYKSKKLALADWTKTEIENVVGVYRMEPAGFNVEISQQADGFLTMKTPRGTTHQLYPISRDSLVMLEDGNVIRILKNGQLYFWRMNARKI